MSNVDVKFRDFCNNLRMANTDVANVRTRYERIRGCLNREFWGGEGYHTLYVGSYGRGTAIHLSDIDIIYEIPYSTYCQYDGYFGNGQSALLQKVKETLHLTYPFTRMKGDGQVVDVDFSDGIKKSFSLLIPFLPTHSISRYFLNSFLSEIIAIFNILIQV